MILQQAEAREHEVEAFARLSLGTLSTLDGKLIEVGIGEQIRSEPLDKIRASRIKREVNMLIRLIFLIHMYAWLRARVKHSISQIHPGF